MACSLTLRHCCSPEATGLANLTGWLMRRRQLPQPSNSTRNETFTDEHSLQG